MKTNVVARAVVTLSLEITVPETWGGDCSIEQIHKQAAESAARYIHDGSLARMLPAGSARIVGEARVSSVITEKLP